MSLKLIHVIYLGLAALFALVLAAWAAAQFLSTRESSYLMVSVPALLTGPACVLWLTRFLRQARGADWL